MKLDRKWDWIRGQRGHSLSRRHFIAGTAAGMLFPIVSKAMEPLGQSYTLTAAKGYQRLDPTLPFDTETWSFNGRVPGPLLRVRQGERLAVDFRNELEEGSAIHWHGIRIDNAMDGVVGLTQASVLPRQTFHYHFRVPDAGTYWYHAHQRSSEQVGRGLYGVLVVEESSPPDVDDDLVLALDDWRLDDKGVIQPSFDNLHDIAHAGRIGNWLTVNGKGSETVQVTQGARLRCRLLNTANSLVMPLQLPPWKTWVVALDGMPLDTPIPTEREVVLAPGQRMDLVVDVPLGTAANATLDFRHRDTLIPLVHFSPSSSTQKSPRRHPPQALPPNPVSPTSTVPDGSVSLVMRGGAMGDLQQAEYQGQRRDLRTLARSGKVWAQNGVVGRSGTPLLSASLGSTQEILFDNRTAWPHAMHLHGHHFEVPGSLAGIGAGRDGAVLRDTVLIGPREALAVRFCADNPGKWLLHCHMLEHQSGGMVTWVDVG